MDERTDGRSRVHLTPLGKTHRMNKEKSVASKHMDKYKGIADEPKRKEMKQHE